MKLRRLLCLVLLPLLLVACSGPNDFSVGENGGFLDDRTGLTYHMLSPAFEAIAAGEEYGVLEDEDLPITFFEIPDEDAAKFLTDEDGYVYYAGDPDDLRPADWTVTAALFCREEAISVVQKTLTADADGEALSLLLSLWFEGEGEEELPPGSAEKTLRVKLQSAEFPGIVYCFSFAKYASGDAYCYELLSGRTVKLPASLTVLIVGENG